MTPGPGDTRSNSRTWHKIIDELGGSSREYFAVRERGVRKGAGLWRGGSGVQAGGVWKSAGGLFGPCFGGPEPGRAGPGGAAVSRGQNLGPSRRLVRAVRLGGLGQMWVGSQGMGAPPGAVGVLVAGGAVGAAVVLAAGMFTFLEVAPALGYHHSVASSTDLRPTGIPRGS